jgi:hypothetical protein
MYFRDHLKIILMPKKFLQWYLQLTTSNSLSTKEENSWLQLFSLFCCSIHVASLRTEVYFCHQNQNAENIGNFTTLLKSHNIGTHLKGIETSFQVAPLFFKSSHFWVSYNHFLKFSQNTFSLYRVNITLPFITPSTKKPVYEQKFTTNI